MVKRKEIDLDKLNESVERNNKDIKNTSGKMRANNLLGTPSFRGPAGAEHQQLEHALEYNRELKERLKKKDSENRKLADALEVLRNSVNGEEDESGSIRTFLNEVSNEKGSVSAIPVDKIRHAVGFNRFTHNYDPEISEGFNNLVNAIKEDRAGFFVILVRKVGDLYEIIWGHRRFEASIKAGKELITAIVVDVEDEKAYEMRVAENRFQSQSAVENAYVTYEGIEKYSGGNVNEYLKRFGTAPGGNKTTVYDQNNIGKYLRGDFIEPFSEQELSKISHIDALALSTAIRDDESLYRRRMKKVEDLASKGEGLTLAIKIKFLSDKEFRLDRAKPEPVKLRDPASSKVYLVKTRSKTGHVIKINGEAPEDFIEKLMQFATKEWSGFE